MRKKRRRLNLKPHGKRVSNCAVKDCFKTTFKNWVPTLACVACSSQQTPCIYSSQVRLVFKHSPAGYWQPLHSTLGIAPRMVVRQLSVNWVLVALLGSPDCSGTGLKPWRNLTGWSEAMFFSVLYLSMRGANTRDGRENPATHEWSLELLPDRGRWFTHPYKAEF